MTIKEAFVQLGKWIGEGDEELDKLVNKASVQNAWFTPENIAIMLSSIQKNYLEAHELDSWLGRYPERLPARPAKVAMILAGNLPLVGFHDLLCVLLSGHHALIKLSEKDDILLPGLLHKMEKWYPAIRERISIVDRIVHFDAVIATGTNQSAANFERYFSRYPNIIRKNRNSVAIITGNESSEDMKNLGNDIFSYFGLGCRNVSKLYVPQQYDFEPLVKELNSFKDVVNHSKYKNNYDYHLASALIGNQDYMSNDCLLLFEEASIASKVAVLHYGYYQSLDEIRVELMDHADGIQCVVGDVKLPPIEVIAFGQAQHPRLGDYADNIDTMEFLISLSS